MSEINKMEKRAKDYYMKRPLSLQEALDYLDELMLEDEEHAAVYIEPPDVDENVSGEDDGEEEEEGTTDNVCPSQLKAGCEIVLANGRRIETVEDTAMHNIQEEYDSEDDKTLAEIIAQKHSLSDIVEEPLINNEPDEKKRCLRVVQPTKSSCPIPPSNKDTIFKWCKETGPAMCSIFPMSSYEDCRGLHPHQQFEKFIDMKILEHICEESGKYAVFNSKPNPNFTTNELLVFIGILLVSGYNYHTRVRSLWSTDDDLRNEMVVNAMRRNRFQQILQFLHFTDNNDKNLNDKMWKLRPITDHLKANMLQHFHPEQNLSYDESMIAYFGRHGCKQFIKGKPLRFGYKVWSLCTPAGYLVNFEIYQGKNPRSQTLYEERFGKCAAPLLNMIDDFKEDIQTLPFSFFFDNLFTGFPLLLYLKQRGYNGTGTIRENRIPKCCPTKKKDVAKKERGFAISIQMEESNIRLTHWVDNSVVSIASTAFGLSPISKVLRYSRIEKKKVTVDRPCAITQYNKYMCGVDRMDQNVNLYRISNRGKKWWSSIFTWLIDVAVQNAWQLHRVGFPQMSQVEFRRQIAIFYCKHYGTKPTASGPTRKRSEAGTVAETLRFDKTEHYVLPCEKRRRCAGEHCTSVGRTMCGKCDVGLCVKCFMKYHSK